jgi:peptidoglycan/xylan/chitin deacetylase (PgdA/CDA1 family)
MQARRTEAQHLALRHPGKVWINGHLQRKAVALTFDDGPESVVTPQVLDILARYQLKATFFFVGFMLRKHAAVVKRTYHEGHLILNHSYDHPSFDALSNAQIQSQLRRTEDLLFKLIGKRPALFRPPAGVIDNRIQAEIDAAGYQTILWSYDPFDWAGLPVDTLVQRVVSQARNGEIILLHSRLHTDSTAVALPRIIEGLQARGFELLRLDELIPVQAYR